MKGREKQLSATFKVSCANCTASYTYVEYGQRNSNDPIPKMNVLILERKLQDANWGIKTSNGWYCINCAKKLPLDKIEKV